MKKTISTMLAIAGVIAFLFLIGGGIRMSTLASQSGDSVAEYYYQSMGTCMIGFSFVAVGLLGGLSWMVAAWPDNQEIVAPLTRNNSSDSDNQTTSRPDVAAIAASGVEKNRDVQRSFYASLASIDANAPGLVRSLLYEIANDVKEVVWGPTSVTAYADRLATSAPVCTIGSNGMIDLHLESLNTRILTDVRSLTALRRLVRVLSGTVVPKQPPFELLTFPISRAISHEGYACLVRVLQVLAALLRTPEIHA